MDPKTFLETVVSIIQRNRPLDGRDGLTAARLGWLLRSLSGIDWTEFGYPKLSAVLADLQAAGLVRVGNDSKGALTVWPVDEARSADTEDTSSQRDCDPRAPFRRLRTPAWNAFVLPKRTEHDRRYLQRNNGFVHMGSAEPPGGIEQWVEVESIPEETQRNWARELLTKLGLDSDAALQDAVIQPNWHNAIRDALATRDRIFASQWNRIRSTRVQAHVEAWCERNNVPHDLVFQPYRFARPEAGIMDATIQLPRAPSSTSPSELRKVLLYAIARMTTDELLALNIPARHLLAASRPELVRE